MFWRMAGLSTASPVETILDKENFTLEELLDEDEIIQECKALNGRLINFLRERTQVEQLLRFIVEEAPEDFEKNRAFKIPFVACEIFTCEVDIILKTLVDDEELMNLLFSFLDPKHPHSTLLAGYFSKVVICLMLRKAVPFMNYVQAHQEIFCKLVDLIGITSILEVLIRLIGADEHMYNTYMDAMQWLENTNILDMIVDKFKSSDSPELHANAAEALCAITRYAPPAFVSKISSPGFVGKLFCNALEDSRPKSVLVHSLSVCISLLDPKKSSSSLYYMYRGQPSNGSSDTASAETVVGMLKRLGDLVKLLDVSSAESVLETTYGRLQPPLGKHRLKIVEFISILLSIGSEAAEMELIQLGVIQRILDLFFEYPYNNFLHHQVENIMVSCLESKKTELVEHVLRDCKLVEKIIAAEKNSTLTTESNTPTFPAEGRSPPRIGNIGHITRLSNKLVQMKCSNSQILEYLQENTEWTDWNMNVLNRRNAMENVNQWACGRPTALQDRHRDSDDDDFRDRDYDVAALASNLSQAFQYGIYSNEDVEEAHGSLDRDDEDVYFDDESAEVVISSLRLGDDQDRARNEHSTNSVTSPSPNAEASVVTSTSDNVAAASNDDELVDTATSSEEPDTSPKTKEHQTAKEHISDDLKEDRTSVTPEKGDKTPEWVEWRETSNIPLDAEQPAPNGDLEMDLEGHTDGPIDDTGPAGPSTSEESKSDVETASDNSTTDMNGCAAKAACENCTAVDDMETVATETTDSKEESVKAILKD